MKATETHLLTFLQVAKQFVIPIYQRTYSWKKSQCQQLWDDIIKVAQDDTIPSHFIGSIVYIEKGISNISRISQVLVIDGQQRLTTLSLLLAALGQNMDNKENMNITKKQLCNYYLFNDLEIGDKKNKLILTQSDRDTLICILEEKELPNNFSKNIVNNFQYFEKLILTSNIDLNLLYKGLQKLVIVDISLDANHDNPQLIFESLNSTGLELSQADLIRNYMLIGLDQEKQKEIYEKYWYKMENLFGHSEGIQYFDNFMRDYLTIKTRKVSNIKNVYVDFKKYSMNFNGTSEDLISEIYEFSKLYSKLAFENEDDEQIQRLIHNINTLKTDVAYPFLLQVLADFKSNLISKDELYEIFLMIESFVFRRAICGIPTNALNKLFPSLLSNIDKESYVQSIKLFFNLSGKNYVFPTDSDFQRAFCSKNIYEFRNKKYLLEKLENHNTEKEFRYVGDYTIEHVMPQNENLSEEWKKDLGSNWKQIHEDYLHTIGNITLTGYNPELSDKSFMEKRDMNGGFARSPLSLNSSLSNLDTWNESEIKKRAINLSKLACLIWEFPVVDSTLLETHQEEYLDGEEDGTRIIWDDKLRFASSETRTLVSGLIAKSNEKLDFKMSNTPFAEKMSFYIQEPFEAKNRFAILSCGKNTSNISFRVDPSTFKFEGEKIKSPNWYFNNGTERRIKLTEEDIPLILQCLEHSFSATVQYSKKRRNAAKKAWKTRINT